MKDWLSDNKPLVQSVTLAVLIAASFTLFAGLRAESGVLAAVSLGLIGLGMAVTVWVK